MAASTSSPRLRWLALAERRLPALTRLKRVEALPIALDRRRIYVVPTRFGLVFSLTLLVMLIGALNYNNNPALLLTCTLGAAAYQSVFTGFAALNRLRLVSIRTTSCHAGSHAQVVLTFDPAGRARHALRLRHISGVEDAAAVFDTAVGSPSQVAVSIPTEFRGWQPLGRLRLSCEFPYGLFHVWSWLHPDVSLLVYPRPEQDPPPLPDGGDGGCAATRRRAGDEFALLREYRASDPRRLIAWKASARHDQLLVRELDRPVDRHIVLDWQLAGLADAEACIARLTAWVLAAERRQIPFALQIPGQRLGPGSGDEHVHACLRALALLPATGT